MYQGSDLADASASELTELFRHSGASPMEAVDAVLHRIARFNPVVNAFSHLDEMGAREAARHSEARWYRSEPLSAADGVPATVKDLHAVAGWPLGRGTKTSTAGAASANDAPISARLREAGAIFVGATTTPEFGWIGITASPATGITNNPHDTTRTAGGSSGGAAAAAALGCGALHTGSDALGSIRIPAAFCGVAGLKPTYGLVPSYPSSVMGSLSHTGPIARSVEDVGLMLDIVSRRDFREWSPPSADAIACLPRMRDGIAGLKVGLVHAVDRIEPSSEIVSAVDQMALALAEAGAIVRPLTLDLSGTRPVAETLWKAGCAVLIDAIPEHEWELVDAGLWRIAEAGRRLSATDLRRAEFARDEETLKLTRSMADVDLLLLPTLPILPFFHGTDRPGDGRFTSWLDWDCSCFAFNVTQNPALTVPCGQSRDGLPLAVQIVGHRHMDQLVLRAGWVIEQAVQPIPVPVMVQAAISEQRMPIAR